MKYYIKIKDFIICFQTAKPIVFPASFSPFHSSDEFQADIIINFFYDKEYKLQDATLLMEQRTHRWYSTLADEKILKFSKRAALDMSDPWILVMKNDKEWELYLSSDSANELFDRPWLQRAFSYYINNKNMYISHGGCCTINDCGVLILGECGQGKSTLIELLYMRGITSLSDDRILISGEKSELICFPTPWNIKNPKFINDTTTTIKHILFLEHSCDKKNSLYAIDKEEAQRKIVSQLYLPFPYNLVKAYADASRFVSKYLKPTYKFSFTPDNTAVDYLIDRLT